MPNQRKAGRRVICGWPNEEIYNAVQAYAKHRKLKNCYGGPNMAEAMIELLQDSTWVRERIQSPARARSQSSWDGEFESDSGRRSE